MIERDCYNPFEYAYDINGQIDEGQVIDIITTFLESIPIHYWDFFHEPGMLRSLLSAIAMLFLEFYPKQTNSMYELLNWIWKIRAQKCDEVSFEINTIFEKFRLLNKDAKCFKHYDIFTEAPKYKTYLLQQACQSIFSSYSEDIIKFNETIYNKVMKDFRQSEGWLDV